MSWPVPGTLMVEPTESESKVHLALNLLCTHPLLHLTEPAPGLYRRVCPDVDVPPKLA